MKVTRAAYLDRLRRAFLLRVHPDRFRNRSQDLRQQQAHLVQALANRFGQADFQNWQNYSSTIHQFDNNESHHAYSFSLEKRDGSLFRTKIHLNKSVDDILNGMVKALEKCGAGNTIPSLDERPHQDSSSSFSKSSLGRHRFSQNAQSSGTETDYQRYNVKSNKGRNLLHFVTNDLDPHEVSKRKMARTDAQAAALAVRRLFKFQAVDATRLGWSSGNVAILFQRLVELHVEHHAEFRVESFYPLRLSFSPFDLSEERRYGMSSKEVAQSDSSSSSSSRNFSALDVYGGVLRLHPGSTPLQWLVHLRQVTPASLETVLQRRAEVDQCKGLLRSRHNMQLLKGYSAASDEFYRVLHRLCQLGRDDDRPNSISSFELVAEPLVVKVEASNACHRRKPTVTSDGSIQLSEDMCSDDTILEKISHLGVKARQRHAEYEQQKQQCQAVAKEIQWQLGLPRAVYRTGVIQQDDFLNSLYRMKSELNDGITDAIRAELAGSALAITGSGPFCHLADDGSVVVPHDWT